MVINETEDCNGGITNVLLLLSFTKSEKTGLQGIPRCTCRMRVQEALSTVKPMQFKAGSLRGTRAIKIYLHLMYKIKYMLRT